MIIATAGHVDHGKTTLLQAITGVNADRLPEEKARGMTIDLGYAYWPQPDGRVLGFIDVPGHEKFLSNMLAGVGGIDHALLVVACDDGVMAQTREHLAILQLTGKPTLTVALTKTDRVAAPGWRRFRQRSSRPWASWALTPSLSFPPRRRKTSVLRNCAAICCSLRSAPARSSSGFAWRWTALLPSKARGWWSPGRRSPAKYGSGIPYGLPASTRRCASAACMLRIKRLSRRTPGSALR